MTSAVAERSRFGLIDALNAEWSRYESDDRLAGYGRAEVTRWGSDYPALSGCRSPADVLAAIRAEPDPTLLDLISIHQSGLHPRRVQEVGPIEPTVGPGYPGDAEPVPLSASPTRTAGEFAGRIVLQTMLGKLVVMARRDHRHAVEDYVGSLWARVGNYPLDRRPRRVAANLALDTLKSVTDDRVDPVIYPWAGEDFERLDHRQWAEWGLGGAAGSSRTTGESVDDLTAHRVLRIARELELIDDCTRRLLLSVYADGLSSREAADKYGLSPTTVRFRCSRAVRRMARHAAAISSAA